MPDDPPKKKRRPFWRKRVRRSTAEGQHVPVLLADVLRLLDPQPGHVVADCTLGFAGHALPLLERVGPTGQLVACDLDCIQPRPGPRESSPPPATRSTYTTAPSPGCKPPSGTPASGR